MEGRGWQGERLAEYEGEERVRERGWRVEAEERVKGRG